MANQELKYWLAFARSNKLGPIRFNKLRNAFSSFQTAWQAGFLEYTRAGLEPEIAAEIAELKKITSPEHELELMQKSGVCAITIIEEGYPRMLKEIYNPPPIIFYRGKLARDEYCLAVVGTRKPSTYGRQATADLVSVLARHGITIVSGLALGIDALAHQATIAEHGKTWAVLGCGLDIVYPAAHYQLAEKIIENNGAIISEHPVGTPPLKHHFPQRNRIIAGLALGVLVIEAPESSGALITSSAAAEYNREVFALPGSIYNQNSAGTNALIANGATITRSALDILDALHLESAPAHIEAKKILPENETERAIYQMLSDEPVHIDKIIKQSGLGTAKINSALTLMEIKGIVRSLGGGNYILAR